MSQVNIDRAAVMRIATFRCKKNCLVVYWTELLKSKMQSRSKAAQLNTWEAGRQLRESNKKEAAKRERWVWLWHARTFTMQCRGAFLRCVSVYSIIPFHITYTNTNTYHTTAISKWYAIISPSSSHELAIFNFKWNDYANETFNNPDKIFSLLKFKLSVHCTS